MILSVSRRTDIPAFYSEWFFNRIKEGFVLVRNPFNRKQVSKIYLNPHTIDCIVFWTKNPNNMLDKLSRIDEYSYYFQFTLNPYDKNIEPYVSKKKYIINTFAALSKKIGKERVIWRYDPIILTDTYDIDYHIKWFEFLASKLSQYTNKCIISFLDLYSKTQRNFNNIELQPITYEKMELIACQFAKIASKYNLRLETCSEEIDLNKYGIKNGKCIDDKLISDITGKKLIVKKDLNQRLECGCVKSIDIGEYNTCKHGCIYCYANYSNNKLAKNVENHESTSPILIGNLIGDEKIIDRNIKRDEYNQISFI